MSNKWIEVENKEELEKHLEDKEIVDGVNMYSDTMAEFEPIFFDKNESVKKLFECINSRGCILRLWPNAKAFTASRYDLVGSNTTKVCYRENKENK